LKDLRDRRLDALVEHSSGFRGFRPPCGALHKFHTNGAFQRNQRAVQGLQRTSKVARGGRLAALLDNRHECFEVVQTFHAGIPVFRDAVSQNTSTIPWRRSRLGGK
jgi:hypothetical protein